MLRLTPLRTMTRTGAMLSGDQRVEGAADVVRRHGNVDPRPVVAEQNQPELSADCLLVALQRLPGALAVDANRSRPEQLLHRCRVAAGQAQCCEEAEGDRPPVGYPLVSGSRLERVRERVAEVQDLALGAVLGVAQADRGLEGGAAPDELVVRQLPEWRAREQAGLHDLGHPFAPLLCGERLEE